MSGDVSVIGNVSTICPEQDCNQNCYVPCEHTDSVVREISSPLISRDQILQDYIYGALQQQENFLRVMCDWEPDVCQIGEWLGYPCKQCVPIEDCCCPQELGKTNWLFNEIYQTPQSDSQFCFTDTAEGTDLYQNIIDAMRQSISLVRFANAKSVETVLQLIWPESRLVTYQNSTMHIFLGREPTNLELSIKNLIAKALPVPIGTCIQLVNSCDS